MPTRLPIFGTAGWITIAHHWGAPDWLWGALFLSIAAVWFAVIFHIATSDEITEAPFNEKEKR